MPTRPAGARFVAPEKVRLNGEDQLNWSSANALQVSAASVQSKRPVDVFYRARRRDGNCADVVLGEWQ